MLRLLTHFTSFGLLTLQADGINPIGAQKVGQKAIIETYIFNCVLGLCIPNYINELFGVEWFGAYSWPVCLSIDQWPLQDQVEESYLSPFCFCALCLSVLLHLNDSWYGVLQCWIQNSTLLALLPVANESKNNMLAHTISCLVASLLPILLLTHMHLAIMAWPLT